VSATVLTIWALAGVVLGWVFHPLSVRWFGYAPLVTWTQALLLFFVAAILAGTARATARAMRGDRVRPEPHRMVNRFVMARACALVGALVAGVYAGYGLSWVGLQAELGTQRIVRSAVTCLGAAAMVAAAVMLERACRVGSDDDAP
jgi:Protein of unknown function (DUF3180)